MVVWFIYKQFNRKRDQCTYV